MRLQLWQGAGPLLVCLVFPSLSQNLTLVPPHRTPQGSCRYWSQSEHIGQWATPHHLSDVRRGAPSWIWDYLAHSDIAIYV